MFIRQEVLFIMVVGSAGGVVLSFSSNLTFSSGQKNSAYAQIKDSRGDLLKYSDEVIWLLEYG